MDTTIKQISDVEYELELTAKAEDLAPEIDKAVRQMRTTTTLKGFRPGKVPLSLVKKMHGRALAYGVAEKAVQDAYEKNIVDGDEHDVLGQPKITELEYEMDGDLRAVIRFGVRPAVELQDLSGETITKLVHEVTDEEVDKEIDRLRREHADLAPSEEGAGEADVLTVDMQELDPESGSPLIGKKEEGVTFDLDDERLMDELREALLGKKAGESVRVHLPHGEHDHDHDHGEEHDHGHAHTHFYEVTLREVKRRELPELDDEFVKEATDGNVEDVETLRKEIADQMRRSWQRQSDELLESRIVERMIALHPVPVPDSAVEFYLDSFVEDVRQRNDGRMPEDFDVDAFRQAMRGEAERQARWMLVRDKVVADAGLEVTEEDLDEYFGEMAGEGLTPDIFRRYYESMPGTMERVRQRLLSKKVFATLSEQFQIVEKDREAFEAEMEPERE